MSIKLSPREQMVFDYLKTHKGITVKECSNKIGTTELRKIMSNFRDKGFIITDVWEYGEDRNGNEIRFKRYFITGKTLPKYPNIPGFNEIVSKFEKLTIRKGK